MERQIEIIPFGRTLDKLWALGGRVLRFFPSEAPDYMSEHYHGAEAMLVRLDDDPYVSAGSYYFKSDLLEANLSGFGYQDPLEAAVPELSE